MRMRRKKHREERFNDCIEYAITNIEDYDKLSSIFKNTNPIHMEIGCGKGKFITELALLNPDINYIAIEKCMDVIIMAMEKVKENKIENVRFIWGDADLLRDKGFEKEVSRIYINFCDPWKKSGQKKRRLTHAFYLSLYEKLLTDDGEVHFKTDNKKLFEFSLNSFADYDVKMKNITLDLHNSDFKGNIMTEYETNFVNEGLPIYRCEFTYRRM